MDSLFSLSKIININKNLMIFIIMVFCTGVFMLYSASGGNILPWANRQILYFLIFIPIASIIALTNINIWYKMAYIIYGTALLMLIYVEFLGHTAMGATRWIRFAGFSIQPSDTMKIGLIIGLSRYFSEIDIKQIRQFKYLIIPVLMIIAPVLLVLKQPDLGTAFILMAIGFGILFIVGVQIWKFVLCGVLFLTSAPIIWKYGLHNYQKQRLEVFLDLEKDTLGSGYNITQSKIAIGSGGLFGKGYLKGSQGQLDFLPEKQTDFIFTMYTEEIGFFGGLFLILLYLIILGFIFFISFKSKHTFARLISSGTGFIFFFHIFINIGMVMGILPIVGVPLPFMSYGGTITAISLILIGFLLNSDLYKDTEIITK